MSHNRNASSTCQVCGKPFPTRDLVSGALVRDSIAGAIVGAFAFEYVLHALKDLPDIGALRTGKHWQLWMGLFIVAVVILAPRGLLGLVERFTRRKEVGDER